MIPRRWFTLTILMLLPALGPDLPFRAETRTDPTPAITCLANEGLLLESDRYRVLIDGLFGDGLPEYARLPPVQRVMLETGQPPYDGIDLVLVSHPHRDHFDAEAVARFLRHNPQATLVSSAQVIEATRSIEGAPSIDGQLLEATPPWQAQETVMVQALEVTVLRLRHEHERNYGLHNLGHVFTLGGTTFLHIGDAEMADENFAPHALPEAGIDVALLPFWYLTSETGRALVETYIRPQRIIALHVPPHEAKEWAHEVKRFYPDALMCTKPLQPILR